MPKTTKATFRCIDSPLTGKATTNATECQWCQSEGCWSKTGATETFLLADLLCCAAVITIFYGFFNKKINSKLAASSIFCGLIFGLLFFPSMNFQTSILVGNILPIEFFSSIIINNLLFISFAIAILIQLLFIVVYSLRSSFK